MTLRRVNCRVKSLSAIRMRITDARLTRMSGAAVNRVRMCAIASHPSRVYVSQSPVSVRM